MITLGICCTCQVTSTSGVYDYLLGIPQGITVCLALQYLPWRS